MPEDQPLDPITSDEVRAVLAGDRLFKDRLFVEGAAPDDESFAEAVFENCRFHSVRFANADVTEVRFTGCSFYDAEARVGSTFAFCDLRAASFDACNLIEAAFDRCELYEAVLRNCNLRSARFHQCDFAKTLSRKVVMARATFEDCNLSYADLTAATLPGCVLTGCRLVETILVDADLSGADLRFCQIDHPDLERARLPGANLLGARINGLNLAVLADYSKMKVGLSQQQSLLEELGLDIQVDPDRRD